MSISQRLAIITLKYIPIIASMAMCIHVLVLLLGICVEFADWTFSLPIIPCAVCCIWSKAFNFCILHRLQIIYTCLVSYCIKYQDVFGFGECLQFARVAMLILGISLIILLLIHYIRGNEYASD